MDHPFQAFTVAAITVFLIAFIAIASHAVPVPSPLTVFLIAFALIMVAVELQVSFRLAGNNFNVREAATGNSLALFAVVASLAMIQTLTDEVKFCGPALAVYKPPIPESTVQLFGFVVVAMSALVCFMSFTLAKRSIEQGSQAKKGTSLGDYACAIFLCLSLSLYIVMIYSEGVSC